MTESLIASRTEARYLVDSYYLWQEHRKRTNNQIKALEARDEPTLALMTTYSRIETLEREVGKELDAYSMSLQLGRWAREVRGVGPVIAAGLLSHIDVTVPTVGHIWRYAGLDPTSTWERGHKRPWNASLKRLCWILGRSFVYASHGAKPEDPYHAYIFVYADRKAWEEDQNNAGAYRPLAEQALQRSGLTENQKTWYSAGKLPPARIHLRAMRYAVKLFLSHYHHRGYELATGSAPPKPYVIEHLGHAHWIEPPPMVQ